jgi:hypothetical protein
VNPCQATLDVELSLTLVPKSTKTHGYTSSRESPRERHSATSDSFPTKPPRGFILPKQEVRKEVSRDIASLNIIKGKHNRKVAFMFKYLFLDLIIEPGPRFYMSFLAGIIYKKPKLRIRDLPALSKKSCKLKTHLYGARFKEE